MSLAVSAHTGSVHTRMRVCLTVDEKPTGGRLVVLRPTDGCGNSVVEIMQGVETYVADVVLSVPRQESSLSHRPVQNVLQIGPPRSKPSLARFFQSANPLGRSL